MNTGLGRRIAIIGPTSSGKSTLARRLGTRLGYPVLHLDQIAFKKNTAWERQLDSELIAAQNEFITGHDNWIIEGNYKVCMARRLRLAESVIWCDLPLGGCILRFLLRCLRQEPDRAGGLPGAIKEFSFGLIVYTLRHYPKNKRLYAQMIASNPHLNIVRLERFSQVRQFCNQLDAETFAL